MGPAETIAKHKADRATWSPDQILDDLAALPPLPDEYDPSWQEDAAWDHAYKLIALSDLVAEHRLSDGIGLVLDRMAHGDPGQIMRGMRHALEATVNPEWWRLAEICLSRCSSPRAGTRFWAVEQLGVIRDAASVPTLVEMLDDPEYAIAAAACRALVMVAQDHTEIRPNVVEALRAVAERNPDLAGEVEADLDQLDEMEKAAPEEATATPGSARQAAIGAKVSAAKATGSKPPAKRAAPARATGNKAPAKRAAPAKATGKKPSAKRAAPAKATGKKPSAKRAAPAKATGNKAAPAKATGKQPAASRRAAKKKPSAAKRR